MQTRTIQISANSGGKNFGRSKSPPFPRVGPRYAPTRTSSEKGQLQTPTGRAVPPSIRPITGYRLLIASHQITNHLSPTVQISTQVHSSLAKSSPSRAGHRRGLKITIMSKSRSKSKSRSMSEKRVRTCSDPVQSRFWALEGTGARTSGHRWPFPEAARATTRRGLTASRACNG
jgi:hypothetical protein